MLFIIKITILSKLKKHKIINFLDEASPNFSFPSDTPYRVIIAFKPISSLDDFISKCNKKIKVEFATANNSDKKLKLTLDNKNLCFLFEIKNEDLLNDCYEIINDNIKENQECMISVIKNQKIKTNLKISVLYDY